MRLAQESLLIFSICLVACNPSSVESSPAGTQSHSPFLRIMLRDVQGLYGGSDVWLYAEGWVVVQSVDLRGRDKEFRRYESKATEGELQAIQQLIELHHFSTLALRPRSGVPDVIAVLELR